MKNWSHCDDCPEGKDKHPHSELSWVNGDLLCPICAASRHWLVSSIPNDDYDRITKCGDDQ